MPTATLRSNDKRDKGGRSSSTDTSTTITHNNARLYNHSDGKTYEYVGDDLSSNRIYRDTGPGY
jgi:hypothetical protein